MSKHAILVIDMLNDFVDPKGALFCPDGQKIIPKIREMVDFAHENGIHVVFVQEAPGHGPQSMHGAGNHHHGLRAKRTARQRGKEVVHLVQPGKTAEFLHRKPAFVAEGLFPHRRHHQVRLNL